MAPDRSGAWNIGCSRGASRRTDRCGNRLNADVAATAKKDLRPGDTLDGEEGYTVFGKLTPATTSLAKGYLPLGLAHHVRLIRPRGRRTQRHLGRREIDETLPAVRIRKEQEALNSPAGARKRA